MKLGLPLAMLILGEGRIHAHFGSEVGITFGNADPGGGRSVLTLEVKLGLPLAMLILGGGICAHLGLPLAMLILGGADPHSLWK